MKRSKRTWVATTTLPALIIALSPATSAGVTAPDLSSRIRIDGRVTEYTDDEWILDQSTVFRESDRDSRWGANNDVWRVAATWDETHLYLAVEGSIRDSRLMVLVEHAGGGLADLISAASIRRNIEFFSLLPNAVITASRSSPEATVAVVSVIEPLRLLDRAEYTSRYFQPAGGPGALEIALPWSRLMPEAGYVKLLACVTGGAGTGTGDAAPDPREQLSANHQALAHLDNAITVPVDNNHDGQPDLGVAPRSVVSYEFEQRAPADVDGDIDLHLEATSFSPDAGEVLRFQATAAPGGGPATVYLTGEVFSVSGRRVRVLFTDEERVFEAGVEPPWDQWDGRDDRGEIVRGGMYVVLVTGGPSPGAVSHSAKQSVAVVR